MKTERIKAQELKPGDVIEMEFGDDGHFVRAIFLDSRVDSLIGIVMRVQYNDGTGRIFDVCPDRYNEVDRVVA